MSAKESDIINECTASIDRWLDLYKTEKARYDKDWAQWKKEYDALAARVQELQNFKQVVKTTDAYGDNGKCGKGDICNAGLNWDCDLDSFCDQYVRKETADDYAFFWKTKGSDSSECYTADSSWFWRRGRCTPDQTAVQEAINQIRDVQMPAKKAAEPDFDPPSELDVICQDCSQTNWMNIAGSTNATNLIQENKLNCIAEIKKNYTEGPAPTSTPTTEKGTFGVSSIRESFDSFIKDPVAFGKKNPSVVVVAVLVMAMCFCACFGFVLVV
jgi:hypothetical protein